MVKMIVYAIAISSKDGKVDFVIIFDIWTQSWVDMYLNQTNYNCNWVFNQSLAAFFDLSSNGWLASANITALGPQILFTYDCSPYCITINFQQSYFYFSSGYYMLTTDKFGNYMSLQMVSNGPTELLFLAPPTAIASVNMTVPNLCIGGNRCPTNQTQESIILYRNHGNSTLFKQLDNVNLADLQGEVYWLCDYNAVTESIFWGILFPPNLIIFAFWVSHRH
jgi:hypothetical protein